jgi:hypothetical protein
MIIDGILAHKQQPPPGVVYDNYGGYGETAGHRFYEQSEVYAKPAPISLRYVPEDTVTFSNETKKLKQGHITPEYAREVFGLARGDIRARLEDEIGGADRDYLTRADFLHSFGIDGDEDEYIERLRDDGDFDPNIERLETEWAIGADAHNELFDVLDDNGDNELSDREYGQWLLFNDGLGLFANLFDANQFKQKKLRKKAKELECQEPLIDGWEDQHKGVHTRLAVDGVISFRERLLAEWVLGEVAQYENGITELFAPIKALSLELRDNSGELTSSDY